MSNITNRKKILLGSCATGISSAFLFTAVYWLLLGIVAKDFQHPLTQLTLYKYWMGFLIAGFGVQMGMLFYLKKGMHMDSGKTSVATSGGLSAGAMLACCTHHFIEFLPFLGITAAAAFLAKYQTEIFVIGILSNVAGISLMLYMIKARKCIRIFKSKTK